VHEIGVIHGGIKPSNVLVFGRAATPSVKVTDFGLRLADERADHLALTTLAGTLLAD
jgi:serine/threonine protein kinase